MSNLKEEFLKYICQTSSAPLGLEITHAEGPYIFTVNGKKYLDLTSGIGVMNIGHGRPEVLRAIQEQTDLYLHPMVYGEFIMAPQIKYAKALAQRLPGNIDNIFFANSGAEAVEGALKTARKYTRRRQLFSFDGCYHGDTFGALSCQSGETYRRPFEPLLPDISFLEWNSLDALQRIDENTAGVIIEPIQGEGGVRIPDDDFMFALRERCTEVGALLILDEVMTGFGRTGKLFAAEHWGITPDLIVLAKALGGGLPLGAFAGSIEVMSTLSHDPPLAHVTTFGGNPLSCAAGHVAFEILLKENLASKAVQIGQRFIRGLEQLRKQYRFIQEVRGKGCFIGAKFETGEQTMKFAQRCLQAGIIVGWTLHHSNIIRIAPPLILTLDQVDFSLETIDSVLRSL